MREEEERGRGWEGGIKGRRKDVDEVDEEEEDEYGTNEVHF